MFDGVELMRKRKTEKEEYPRKQSSEKHKTFSSLGVAFHNIAKKQASTTMGTS
jgi:hypothetical protein